MAQHNDTDMTELLEEWDDCGYCLKPVSAGRPPVLNTDNCSCAERASFARGPGQYHDNNFRVSTPYEYETQNPNFQVAPLNYTIGHVPPSNTSTNPNDFVGQEGIERQAPALTLASLDGSEQAQEPIVHGNQFLQLNATTTENELFAKRSFFFHSRLPYTMQHYLNTPDEPYTKTFHSDDETPIEHHYTLPAGFLDQGMQFGNDSMIVTVQSSRRSKRSYRSLAEQSSSAARSWHLFKNLDGTLHTGGWMEHDGDCYEHADAYSLSMNVMDEYDV